MHDIDTLAFEGEGGAPQELWDDLSRRRTTVASRREEARAAREGAAERVRRSPISRAGNMRILAFSIGTSTLNLIRRSARNT